MSDATSPENAGLVVSGFVNFIPQPVWATAFGLAQTPCVAGLPYPASGISYRFEYCPSHKR